VFPIIYFNYNFKLFEIYHVYKVVLRINDANDRSIILLIISHESYIVF
jgi:hypothetical protein